MMRKIPPIALALILLLAACGGPAPVAPTDIITPEPSLTPSSTPIPPTVTATIPPITPTLTPLGPTSDLEAVRQRMLHSYENWHSLWMQISSFASPGGPGPEIRFARLQVWVRQPAEVLVIGCRYLGDSDPEYYFVSNGTRFLEADLLHGTTREGEVDPAMLAPFAPPQAMTGTIVDFPLKLFIPAPAGDMIFPIGLAERAGTYAVVTDARNMNSTRPHVVVDFTPQEASATIDRFNVDALTGILLHWRLLTNPTMGQQEELADFQAWPVVYDPELAPDLFKLEVPQRLHFQDGPEWNVVY